MVATKLSYRKQGFFEVLVTYKLRESFVGMGLFKNNCFTGTPALKNLIFQFVDKKGVEFNIVGIVCPKPCVEQPRSGHFPAPVNCIGNYIDQKVGSVFLKDTFAVLKFLRLSGSKRRLIFSPIFVPALME